MNDKIKSNITTSYMLFVFDFGDPSAVDKLKLEAEINCSISEVFTSQKKTDHAKKTLGKSGFNKVLCVYFSDFQTQDGVKYLQLEDQLFRHKKVFLRHLGRENLRFLNLVVTVLKSTEVKKRGLLNMEAS